MSNAENLGRELREQSPATWQCLSELGKRVAFPPDIPFQAAQARGKRYNGTIGQVTDGLGHPLALPAVEAALSGLGTSKDTRDQAILYSPVQGIESLRSKWRAWQRRGVSKDIPSSTPLVTVGLTHGLSLVADLFGGPGHHVVIPAPFWGNYRQTFGVRTGANVVATPAYEEGRYDPRALASALDKLPSGEPAIALLNLPSNPGGYMPTESEREVIVETLVSAAGQRPLVVLCDDAYAGLVYQEEVPRASMFWQLIDRHPQLIPVKVDGGTKEFSYFGGRVGFLTFPFAPESAAALALESKVKCLVRAAIGSPSATAQVVLEQALDADDTEAQVEAVRSRLENRYVVLKDALERVDRSLMRPLPFNAGCFALLELADGLDPEALRQHLLAEHETGLIAIRPNYIRIAFCSVQAEDLPELVTRLEHGCRELAQRA